MLFDVLKPVRSLAAAFSQGDQLVMTDSCGGFLLSNLERISPTLNIKTWWRPVIDSSAGSAHHSAAQVTAAAAAQGAPIRQPP